VSRRAKSTPDVERDAGGDHNPAAGALPSRAPAVSDTRSEITVRWHQHATSSVAIVDLARGSEANALER